MNEVDLGKESPPCVETCPTKALQLAKLETKEKQVIEREIQKLIDATLRTG
jgi:Fe-S-cluster-containing dehydrogenase component